MSDKTDGYHTYLLRVWRAQHGGHWRWHASLEDPRTDERVTFATLDALCHYLRSRQLLPESPSDAPFEASPASLDY